MPPALDALLEALLADPPADALQVLADALLERGELLGEAIALGLALESKTIAANAWEGFLARHRETLLGPAAGWEDLEAARFEWRQGLVHRLTLTPWGQLPVPRVVDELGPLLAAPALLRLRVLEVGALESNGSLDPFWDALPGLPSLRALRAGGAHREYGDEHQISWLGLGSVGAVAHRLPGLEELWCRGSWPDFGDLHGPRLQSLTVVSSTLSAEAVGQITGASLPALTSLELATGDGEYGDSAGLPAFDVLLREGPERFPRLRHLGLCNTPFTNELVEALAHSRLLPRLHSLDLAQGLLDDHGAGLLAQHRAAFAHLERIELGDNVLWEDARQKLCAALPAVRFDRDAPWRTGPKARYVSISE